MKGDNKPTFYIPRRNFENTPWLHVEHENGGKWADLKATIEKTYNSVVEDLIVIVYPETTKLRNKLLSQFEKDQKKRTEETEVLAILDASYFNKTLVQLDGYIYSGLDGNEVKRAVKKENELGL